MMLIGTNQFLETREHFEKTGSYTKALVGTYQYDEFWDEQVRRCMDGYSVGNLWIPGTYYFYLNFFTILGKDNITGRKKKIFPRFTDVDLEYFLILDQARREKKGVIMTKPRRTGFSYKNAGVVVHEYNFYRDAKCVIGAYEKKLSENTMNMSLEGLNFLNKNTVWAKPRNPDTREHVMARHQKVVEGVPQWVGYNSEIKRLTFQDNAFASIGLTANIFLFEEAGLFANIKESYNISEPTWKDGDSMVGLPILFGTAGDMDKGSLQFAEMFYNPEKFNLLAFDNIWDKEKVGSQCGWFLPASRQRFGDYPDPDNDNKLTPLVDADGNSNEKLALLSIMKFRETKKGDMKAFRDAITQYPLNTMEAFLVKGNNIFPTELAQDRKAELEGSKLITDSYWNADLRQTQTGIEFKLSDRLPIVKFPLQADDDKEGCVQIFEQPYADNPIHGTYIAGIDPYDDDQSTTDSLGCIFIMHALTGRIVAEYTGRPQTAKEFYEICRKLIAYYNAICNYENNKKGLFAYFEQKNCLHLLCNTPKILRDQQIISVIRESGNTSKGTNASKEVNKYARMLIREYMLDQAYNQEVGLTNTHTIPSVPLLSEIIYWNEDGNFDRVSALGMLLILRQDRIKIVIEEDEEEKDSFNEFFDRYYRGKAI
jgi:hypothetical protein